VDQTAGDGGTEDTAQARPKCRTPRREQGTRCSCVDVADNTLKRTQPHERQLKSRRRDGSNEQRLNPSEGDTEWPSSRVRRKADPEDAARNLERGDRLARAGQVGGRQHGEGRESPWSEEA